MLRTLVSTVVRADTYTGLSLGCASNPNVAAYTCIRRNVCFLRPELCGQLQFLSLDVQDDEQLRDRWLRPFFVLDMRGCFPRGVDADRRHLGGNTPHRCRTRWGIPPGLYAVHPVKKDLLRNRRNGLRKLSSFS